MVGFRIAAHCHLTSFTSPDLGISGGIKVTGAQTLVLRLTPTVVGHRLPPRGIGGGIRDWSPTLYIYSMPQTVQRSTSPPCGSQPLRQLHDGDGDEAVSVASTIGISRIRPRGKKKKAAAEDAQPVMVEGMEPGHAADELEKRLRQLMEQQVQQLEQRLEAKVGQRLCQIMEQQVQQLEESLEAKVSRICRQMEAKDLEHADLLQQLERMGAKGMHTLQDNLQQQVDELQTKHTVMAESLRAWIDLLADDKASDGGEDDDKSGESGEEEAPDMHGSTDEEDDDNEDLDELSDNIQAGESKIIEKEMNKNPTARLDRRPLRVARRTAVRQEELVASVDTVGRAIKIIEKEMNKNPTARLDRRPLRVARRTAVRQEELVASVDTVGRAIKIIEEEMSTNPAIFTQIANKGLCKRDEHSLYYCGGSRLLFLGSTSFDRKGTGSNSRHCWSGFQNHRGGNEQEPSHICTDCEQGLCKRDELAQYHRGDSWLRFLGSTSFDRHGFKKFES